MSDPVMAGTLPAPVRLRSVALPAEHGAWGLLGEPILLGLLVAPSWAGLGIAVGALGAFLAHHPLKIAGADVLKGRRAPRTAAAARVLVLYAAIAAGGLALAAREGREDWWLPLAAAAPLVLLQLRYEVGQKGRQLLPQLLPAVALGSIAAAEMRAAGVAWGPALAAWALLAAKAVTAVLYVRTRLRLDRGQRPGLAGAVASHVLALALAVGLVFAAHAPWAAVAAFALLLLRAAYGLSPLRAKVRPQVVGLQEVGFGLAFVLILAVGYMSAVLLPS
jgi:hypothetical protein